MYIVARRRGWQRDTTLWVSTAAAMIAAVVTGLVMQATVFARPWGG